jgi:AraC family transcriptional activator of pyochelin receptor
LDPISATPSPGEKLTLLFGALVVSAGVQRFDQPTRVNAALPASVKIVVLPSGRLRITVGNAGEREICGPVALVIRTPYGAGTRPGVCCRCTGTLRHRAEGTSAR